MKTINHILTICGTFLILTFVLVSCSTSKKTALSCPEFSINKTTKVSVNHKINKAVISHYRAPTRKQTVRLSRKNQQKDIVVFNNSPAQNDFLVTPNSVSDLTRMEYSKGLIASSDNAIIQFVGNNTEAFLLKKPGITEHSKDLFSAQTTRCDTIVLKSGSLLIGKVEEIGQNEIKYRKCNNLTGPIISISKYDVSSILYSNGTSDLFGPTERYIPNQTNSMYNNNSVLKTEGLGLAGFISGLVGLFIASIPLGLIAVIFGGISLSKIKNQPQRFKGRGFAIASIVLGIVDVVAMIILLAVIV
jgi:hypothetical protein